MCHIWSKNADQPTKMDFLFFGRLSRVYFKLNLKLIKILVDIYVNNNKNNNNNNFHRWKFIIKKFLKKSDEWIFFLIFIIYFLQTLLFYLYYNNIKTQTSFWSLKLVFFDSKSGNPANITIKIVEIQTYLKDILFV